MFDDCDSNEGKGIIDRYVTFLSYFALIAIFRVFIATGSYAHDMGTNFSTLVNLSADNWAQHMTAAAGHSHHHLPTAASMLTTGPLTTSTGVVHHHQPQYHPAAASMWNLPATSPSCAMSQYLRGAGTGYLPPTSPETPVTGSGSTTAPGVRVSTTSPSGVDLHSTHTHTTPPSADSTPAALIPSLSVSHHQSLVSPDFTSPMREPKVAWEPLI